MPERSVIIRIRLKSRDDIHSRYQTSARHSGAPAAQAARKGSIEFQPTNNKGQKMSAMTNETSAAVTGVEHWAGKGEVRLFLWEKFVGSPDGKPALLFVHGSSTSSRPTFDLAVPGRPDSSVMDWFAERGFACWSLDLEGYGRSDKQRDVTCDIANGADDLASATDYIMHTRGIRDFAIYGNSSGALRAALFAQRHPERVRRLALDAFVWTGAGSPTLEQRRKKLPEFLQSNRRPIDRAFVHSIFDRDQDRKSTRLNSSHIQKSRMPSSA